MRLGPGCRFDQVPAIAVKVFEHGDHAIGFAAGGFDETHAALHKAIMVPGKIIGFQEQEDPPAALVADAGALAFNIPGIPAAVTVVINAAVAAIKVLFSFLGASAPAIAAMANGDQQAIAHTAAVLAGELKTNRGLFFKEHVRSSIKLNNALGTHLTTQTAKLSSAKAELGSRVVTSAGGFGTGGFGQ